jgi:hypothetical protein
MSETVAEFIRALRRRLRRTWLVATLAWAAPVVAALALVLVLLGRRLPEAWPEPTALGGVLAFVALVAGAAVVLRITDATVARAADRQLATKDALSTALEVPPDSPWGERVHRRATVVVAEVPPARAAPIRLPGRRLAVSSGIGALALLLAVLPNPQDDVRRQRAAEQAAIAEAADDLREEADALEEAPDATAADRAAAEALRELAEDLDDTESLEEAMDALAEGEADLQEQVDGDLLAQKAAVQGLDRSLEAQPLPGASGASAAAQLEQAADGLDELDEGEAAALAERLEQLAESQALGNPEAAAALDDAATSLRAGDVAGAQAALGEAAAAQRSGTDAVGTQEAAAAAAEAAGRAQDGLAAAAAAAAGEGQAQGAGQGQGEGEGEGQGEGQGQGEGEGEGEGSGSGNGSGSGSGQGGGSPSGNVGGASGGQGSGQGGPGQSGAGGPEGAGSGENDPTVFDPSFSDGEELEAGGSGTGDPGETIGEGNGGTTAGSARTPLSRVIDRYLEQATRVVERGDLPPSLRDVIQTYFDRLTGGAQ